jgi:hypothetical protein
MSAKLAAMSRSVLETVRCRCKFYRDPAVKLGPPQIELAGAVRAFPPAAAALFRDVVHRITILELDRSHAVDAIMLKRSRTNAEPVAFFAEAARIAPSLL